MKAEVRRDAELTVEARQVGCLFVLFYSSWCPYSRMFLPIFERFARVHEGSCLKVLMDDEDSLWETYDIEVVPTVLLLRFGSVVERLDGVPGEGLTEVQLKEFVSPFLK